MASWHKVYKIFCISVFTLFALILLYYASRVFIRDTFTVNTSSMEPAIMPGSKIYVNKLIFGPRIYTEFKFDEGGELKSFRLPGYRNLKRDDIIVFNYPFDEECTKIQFKINFVYTKRVIGLPGDTLSIVGGFYSISGYDNELSNIERQRLLSMSYNENFYSKTPIFPNDSSFNWTIVDFGPYYIPRKGDTIPLTEENIILYGMLIEYESGDLTSTTHTFSNNYYFVAGDNVFSSKDSRYFGVIPQDYIIGVVSKIQRKR